MTTSKCSECGLIHPPVEPGTCPVANSRKKQEELRMKFDEVMYKYILELQDDVNRKLEKIRTDNDVSQNTFDKCIAFIKKIRNFINNTIIP